MTNNKTAYKRRQYQHTLSFQRYRYVPAYVAAVNNARACAESIRMANTARNAMTRHSGNSNTVIPQQIVHLFFYMLLLHQ